MLIQMFYTLIPKRNQSLDIRILGTLKTDQTQTTQPETPTLNVEDLDHLKKH
jgi:hypothetical protein